jgi:hypothetical protein
MEIKTRSKSLGPGPHVGALTALHRDEWSALFPMLNEYGLNAESVRAMTTAVSGLACACFCCTHWQSPASRAFDSTRMPSMNLLMLPPHSSCVP